MSTDEKKWDAGIHAYCQSTLDQLRMTYQGVNGIVSQPRLIAALNSYPPEKAKDPSRVAELERADAEAQKAQQVIDDDFALFHSHYLIGLWGALEAAIEDLAALRLASNPTLLERPNYAKLKVPIATYERLTPEARRRLTITMLQGELRTGASMGVGQFEKLLNEVELGGKVPDRVAKNLIFAQQARHIVAHRGGRVDERFVASCPGYGYGVGDELKISKQQMGDLLTAFICYMITVDLRVRSVPYAGHETYGDGLRDWLDDENVHWF